MSAPLLLGGFVIWGVAGGVAARLNGSLTLALASAIVAALLCVLITVTFGLALAFTSLPHLAQNVASDPDFLRSRWTDTTAFAIANQFGAAASHLMIAPVVAIVVGLIGGAMGQSWVDAPHPEPS